jgi:hypothetical protein
MRYLIAILREQHRRQHADCTSHSKQMMRFLTDYEEKISSLRNVLDNAGRTPDNCFNLTAAQTDVLEMIGDAESLQKVSKIPKHDWRPLIAHEGVTYLICLKFSLLPSRH